MIWPAESIWEAVYPLLPDFTVEVLPQIDSSNSELMRRIRAGRCEPTLLVAEQQTAGRGRLGRGWHSQVGDSLTFSLALPLAPADWSGLSLAVGVSVVNSLHADLQLKWPNDVWLHGRKLAGILIETAGVGDQRVAVVGIGINIAPPGLNVGDGLSTAPAWLQEVLPGVDAGQALLRIAAPLVQALKAFEIGGFAPFQTQFDQRDLLRDRAVNLSNGTVGMARGVDAHGGLLLQTPDGLQTVTSAEVSVRPAATPTPAG
nr:biotin--[acetyl-CoA-carboxylase] ligase [uncultured Albidiferax sp.]